MALQVIRHAEILVAKMQQLIRSEQDTNPVVSDSIQAEFEDKGKLLQLVDHLGELKFREFHYVHTLLYHASEEHSLKISQPLVYGIHVRDVYNYLVLTLLWLLQLQLEYRLYTAATKCFF